MARKQKLTYVQEKTTILGFCKRYLIAVIVWRFISY